MGDEDDGMVTGPSRVLSRSVGEWAFGSGRSFANPFADVAVEVVFAGPSGQEAVMPAFYDGEGTWRVRFNPGEAGAWRFSARARPADAGFDVRGTFAVDPREAPGFWKATPGRGWGFADESGEPIFVFGDTVYHLFGMAHCGIDVRPFLERRARQGFNLLRVRLPVSPFHPPNGYSDWQTRRTWPWGGSEQAPLFDRFDLGYFRTVDAVVRIAEELGIGLELIMEGWGFEFPFSARDVFTAEWEELWLRYLVARYDAFGCTAIWTPLNEYEYYPNGDWHHKPVADRFQMRLSRWIKEHAPHGHVVAAHNGPRLPPFAERFAADPDAVDAVMFQEWGARDEAAGWLATGIEESVGRSLDGWRGSAVLAEWGYERNPEFELRVPSHRYCDPDHTRRGAWRGAFCGLGVVHGFENSWGPWALLDEDQPGLDALLHLRRFFTELVPFADLRPAPGLLTGGDPRPGRRPLALANGTADLIAAYLPAGGEVGLPDGGRNARWYDPRRGEWTAAAEGREGDGRRWYEAPGGGGERSWDWVLVSAAPGALAG